VAVAKRCKKNLKHNLLRWQMIRFGSGQQGKKIAVGVAWYRPEQWERLREISVDKDILEETHAEWVQNAEKAVQDLRQQGMKPVKVDVDVEELLRWCENQHIAVNGEARSQYAAAKVGEILSKKPNAGD
jgi:hypothetical protein